MSLLHEEVNKKNEAALSLAKEPPIPRQVLGLVSVNDFFSLLNFFFFLIQKKKGEGQTK